MPRPARRGLHRNEAHRRAATRRGSPERTAINRRCTSIKGPLAAGAIALAGTLVTAAAASAQVRLPDFGDPSAAVVSSAAERELGEAFMREIRATSEIIDDPEVASYIQSLGYRIVSAADRRDVSFTFFVIKSPVINAFAAPGGYVGFNSGLIAATESENELASVVAHEVAHVTQRHIARFIERSEASVITTLAGILAAIAIGTQSTEGGQAAAAAVLGSQAQSALNFTRANEQEADGVGMQLLHEAGFDPAAMATFFERLQSASRYYRSPPEFLSTHPVTTSRIADARGRAAQLGFRQRPDSLEFKLMRAKVRVITTEDPERLAAEFKEEIQRHAPSPSPGLSYGVALLDAKAGRLDTARRELEALSREHPSNTVLRVALADVVLQSGDQKRALAMLDDTWRLLPDSRLATRAYCRALLVAEQPEKTLQILEEHQRLSGLDAEMQRLRAEALAALGRTAESQAALAEHFYLRGQIDRAIHQLTLASQQPGNDFYRASRIEARIEQLRGEQQLRTRR